MNRLLPTLVVMAMLVAACGSGGGDTPTTTSGGTGTTQSPGPTSGPQPTQSPPSGSGAVGWFEVDGTRIDATNPARCPAVGFNPDPDDFRVRVSGRSGDENLMLEVQETFDGTSLTFSFMVNITARQYEVELDFDGSEWTVWGTGDPVPGFTYSNEGDRLKGGPVTIIQDWPEGEVGEVVVSFDIPLPTELADRC